ncbi:hypothetical protein AB0I28_14540 [Phytomonospora sp. NPDC050363]|uniref:hypothetical protein n=1 Tax=Phytomonospora sp. NPDC050363 TaxID=3155642 RepID=UPI0033C8453F
MSLIVLTRFAIDPADAGELVTRHAALVEAQRGTGLTNAGLGRIDDANWVGVWRWESAEHLAAVRAAPGPEAAHAFALVTDRSAITVEEIELVDER